MRRTFPRSAAGAADLAGPAGAGAAAVAGQHLPGAQRGHLRDPPACCRRSQFEAYGRLFQDNPLTTYLLDSTVVSVLAVLAVCCSPPWRLIRWRGCACRARSGAGSGGGHDPDSVSGGDDPLYLLMVQLGLRNTLVALVIPSGDGLRAVSAASEFLGVPVELEGRGSMAAAGWRMVECDDSAARADLITLGMLVFISTWSDFLWPLVILDDPGLSLPLGLQQLSSSFSLDWRIVAAGSVVSILPVLVLFVLLQRFILPSASGDAVKG